MANYTHGTGTRPFVYTTVVQLLDDRAVFLPDKEAHVFIENNPDGTHGSREPVTFKQLASRSSVLAAKLLEKGFGPGDRMAVIGDNCPEYLYVEYALARIGVLMFRLPTNLIVKDTLEHLLSKYKCKGIVFDLGKNNQILSSVEDTLPGVLLDPRSAASNHCHLNQVFLMKRNTLKGCVVEDIETLANSIHVDFSAVREISRKINPDEPTFVFPTSGSSGFPKFVVHSHFGIINTYRFFLEGPMNTTDPQCVVCNGRPFSWIGGFQYIPVILGATLVTVEAGTKTEVIYKTMEVEKVTSSLILAYFLHDAVTLSASGVPPPTSLQYPVTGGEIIPDKLIEFAVNAFSRISLLYGSTETLFVAQKTTSHIQDKETANWLAPTPYVEMKLVNDDGELAPVGGPGNVWIRSRFMFAGYLDDDESTQKNKLPSGWFSVGDAANMNNKGEILIVGRTKDVISKGMTKIYPKTIEDVLITHPLVNKAVVVGVPDPRLFNEICACVIPTSGSSLDEDDLKKFCEQAFPDTFLSLVPKFFWIMDSFPLGRTGKVDRKEVVALAADKYGITE